MKKFLPLMLLALLGHSETVNLNKAWNLIGSSNALDVSKIADPNVKIIWRWHNQQWQAYSNDPDIQKILSDKNISTFTVTDPNEGIWIYSLNPTTLTLDTITESTGVKVSYIGDLWGYKWNKILQTFDGDQRYVDGIVEFENDSIKLLAQKTDNQDRRAAAVTEFDEPKTGIDLKVNMITDNKYSKFQTIAVADNLTTQNIISGLSTNQIIYFFAGLSINKNSVSAWYDFMDSDGNYVENDGLYKEFSFDLTDLTDDGDDLEIKISYNKADNSIEYKVIRLDTSEVIFDYSLDLTQFGFENFNGFNEAVVRSRVDDKKANENGEEAIDESLNFVNYFSAQDDEIQNVSSSNVPFTQSQILNKTLCFRFAFKDSNEVTIFDDGYEVGSGTWSVDDNGDIIIDDSKSVYKIVQNGNIYTNLVYLSAYQNDNMVYQGPCMLLNTTDPYNYTVTSSNDIANLIPDYWSKRVDLKNYDLNEVPQPVFTIGEYANEDVKFDTSSNKVTFTVDGNVIASGSYEIDANGVMIYHVNYNGENYTVYDVATIYNGVWSSLKFIVNSENKLDN